MTQFWIMLIYSLWFFMMTDTRLDEVLSSMSKIPSDNSKTDMEMHQKTSVPKISAGENHGEEKHRSETQIEKL